MKKPKVIQMPPPDSEDGIMLKIGDDTFRLTASIELIKPPEPGRVVRIDGKEE